MFILSISRLRAKFELLTKPILYLIINEKLKKSLEDSLMMTQMDNKQLHINFNIDFEQFSLGMDVSEIIA